MPQVTIRHKDGREYEISTADFRRGKHALNEKGEMVTFEEAGFEIVGHPNGEPYEGPLGESAPARAASAPAAPTASKD